MGNPIHIFQKFNNAFGGSELHALGLARVLGRQTSVHLWTEFEPDPRLPGAEIIRRIQPKHLQFPKRGTFLFVGGCWYVGRWLDYTAPRRIVVFHNFSHHSYKDWFKRATRPWHPEIEWVFASEQLRDESGLPGPVVPSPIDIERFRPSLGLQPGSRPFTVGRLSRDVPEKFHADDSELYEALARSGIRVRIMGGTGLRSRGASHPLIELLPEGSEPPDQFLRTLDVFLYRTSSDWFEPFGRVVMEAMSCGLPVVCGERGGYTDNIRHGENGFLFSDNASAEAFVSKLRDDHVLRQKIGAAARDTAVALYGGLGLPPKMIEFYLR